jgi:hypothetical protein
MRNLARRTAQRPAVAAAGLWRYWSFLLVDTFSPALINPSSCACVHVAFSQVHALLASTISPHRNETSASKLRPTLTGIGIFRELAPNKWSFSGWRAAYGCVCRRSKDARVRHVCGELLRWTVVFAWPKRFVCQCLDYCLVTKWTHVSVFVLMDHP